MVVNKKRKRAAILEDDDDVIDRLAIEVVDYSDEGGVNNNANDNDDYDE